MYQAPVDLLSSLVTGGQPLEAQDWRRGLIVCHGDASAMLQRTASLVHLCRVFPDCEWHATSSPGTDEIISNNPHLARTWPVFPDERDKRARSFASPPAEAVPPAVEARLRAARFDVMLCPDSLHHPEDRMLGLRMRVPTRIGFAQRAQRQLVTMEVPVNFDQPEAALFRDMVAEIASLAPRWDLRPQIFPRPEDEMEARRYHEALPRTSRHGVTARRIAVFPFVTTSGGVWFPEFWVRLLDLLSADGRLQPILCGAASDAKRLRELSDRTAYQVPVLAADLSYRVMAAFLRGCAARLGPDSPSRHLATAVGTPAFYFRDMSVSWAEGAVTCAGEHSLVPDEMERLQPFEEIRALESLRPELIFGEILNALPDGVK